MTTTDRLTAESSATARPAGRRRPSATWLILAGIGVVLVVLAAAPYFLDAYSLDVLTLGLSYGVMAMALALLVGYVGLPSLGHAAFVGLGSYASGLLAVHVTDNALAGLVIAAIVGGLAALLIGVISLRLSGVFFLMMTLAFAEIVHQVAIQSDFTGGDNGLSVPAPYIPLLSDLDLPSVVGTYWYVLIVVGVVAALLSWLVRSPFGAALHGSRESPARMASAGYSIVALRLRALVASGALTAVGGALLVQKDGIVAPTILTPSVSVLLLVMVLVGGATSLIGPLVAAVALIYLRAATSSWIGEWWLIVEGALFVVVVLFFPGGMAGGVDRIRHAYRRRTAKKKVSAK